jgi:hypothetical protein
MCPAIVIVDEIILKNPAEVIIAKNNDVIEAVSANGSDQPFHVWILPRGSRCGIPRKRLHDLLGGPLRRGRVGHVEANDPSPIVGQDHEDEQDPERHRGDREEVNGDQVMNMVFKESPP